MQKTKLGLSVGIVAALAYTLGLFSGYVALVILAGYVLLKEDDSWLKYSVVKAIAVAAVFDLFIALINLVPDFCSWISTWAVTFNSYFSYDMASNVISIITQALQIIKTILLIVLALMALSHSTFTVLIVDSLITKHNFFGANPAQNNAQFASQAQYNTKPSNQPQGAQFNAQTQYNAQPQGQFGGQSAPMQNQPQFQGGFNGQAQNQPQFNAAPNQQPQNPNNGQN